MKHKNRLVFSLIAILLLMALLIGYRVYLFVYEGDYQALNIENIERIESTLQKNKSFSFAVVGNIRNSMRIFERRITPLVNESGADFIISLGNAVYDGMEGKYRLLYRGLKKLNIPYVMTMGHTEGEDFGAREFYRHFGPYFFSFHLHDSLFIFLDSTGQTSWKWQIHYLKQQLENGAGYPHKFVFLNDSLFTFPGTIPDERHLVLKEDVSRNLQQLFSRYKVSAVFSAGSPAFHELVKDGVHYIESGGGGGLLLDVREPYQIVNVSKDSQGITFQNVIAPERQGTLRSKFETLKLYLHSLFYMSIFNALLILCIFSLIALKLYSLILRQEHLYRDFNVDEQALAAQRLHILMVTNNYLPFVGGVPLSINRLFRGLRQRGEEVKILAPSYPGQQEEGDEKDIIRCPALFKVSRGKIPISNVFSSKINQLFKNYKCDLVHIHHPFWLGKRAMKIAKRRGLPIIFTYHTRLERYTHYVPIPGAALKNLVAHFLIKHFANRCDAIITPTPSTEEYLRHLGVSALIETIPTGISMDDYSCWQSSQVTDFRRCYVEDDQPFLVSVSRMAKEKNLDFLIHGLAKVREFNRCPFKCLLVGDGPEKKRLQEKVASLGMEGMIFFAGNISPREVARCYLAADFFVFASTSETQGMVLLEAMAGGCPVVAVRASGVYDVVKNGFNGIMVSESTEHWAKAVAELLADPEKLSTLSENSKEFSRQYAEEKIAEQVAKLYRRLILLHQAKIKV